MRLIDADKLMDYANNMKDKSIDANDIARFPTIDPVKHGHWIRDRVRLANSDECYIRSNCCNCTYRYVGDNYNYCPICGAKMDEVSE